MFFSPFFKCRLDLLVSKRDSDGHGPGMATCRDLAFFLCSDGMTNKFIMPKAENHESRKCETVKTVEKSNLKMKKVISAHSAWQQ